VSRAAIRVTLAVVLALPWSTAFAQSPPASELAEPTPDETSEESAPDDTAPAAGEASEREPSVGEGAREAASVDAGPERAPMPDPAPEPPPTPTPFAVEGGVAFEEVDAAIVRVFTVRQVEMEWVDGRRVRRAIAIPKGGHGTGIIVDPRGVVATAKHVVAGARHLAVRMPGAEGAVHGARVVYEDDDLDFALLLIDSRDRLPHVLPLPETAPVLPVRSTVDVVGYPLDADRNHPQSSRGIVSGALEEGKLQLDVTVNPGNSGGPLLANGGLVGIVVAGSNVDAGYQGLAIAVPIAPVYRAYRRSLRDGSLRRAQEHLRTYDQSRRAVVVDAIARLGDEDILQEAEDFIHSVESTHRLDRFIELAEDTTDPDLLAMLSAYFWDAAQVMMERGDGGVLPRSMREGRGRDRAQQLYDLARSVARRAVEADASIVVRSPFMEYLGGENFDPVRGSGTRRRRGGAFRSPTWAEPRYRMVMMLGILIPLAPKGPDEDSRELGSGAQIAALFPFTKLDPEARFRIAPFAGVSTDLYGWSSNYPVEWFLGPEIGVMMRAGRQAGITFLAAWTPGAMTYRAGCTPWGCEETGVDGTLAMARFGLFVKAGRMFFGATLRIGRPIGDGERHLVLTAPMFGGNF